jgi:hypothetical protein
MSSGVRVRVRAADADPADPDIEVELPVAPAGWGREHTDAVANAVGVDTHSACVSLRFAADGTSEGLPAGRAGWTMVKGMDPGDVLVVGTSGGGGAPAPAGHSGQGTKGVGATVSTASGGAHPLTSAWGPVQGAQMPEEQMNYRRLDALLKSDPAEIRKAMQQV